MADLVKRRFARQQRGSQVHGRGEMCTPSCSGTNTPAGSPSAVTWSKPSADESRADVVTNRPDCPSITMTLGGYSCDSGGGQAAPASAA